MTTSASHKLALIFLGWKAVMLEVF